MKGSKSGGVCRFQLKYHVYFNILIFFKREFFWQTMPRVWPGTSPHVLCPSPSEPCCAVLWGDAVPALLGTAGMQQDAPVVLQESWQHQGVSAVCVGLQSPSTGQRRSAASPPWAATPSGGSGTPQSVSTGATTLLALQLSRCTEGTVCSPFYWLISS